MNPTHPTDEPAPTPAVKHRFETLAEALAVAILTADPDGAVEYVNPAARELFWRTEEQLMGDGWLDGVHPDDRSEVDACAAEVRRSGNADRADFRIDVAGYNRWVRARFNPLPAPEDSCHGWVAIFDDVTADRATSEELARRAAHDPLTGLPNRALLRDRLEHAIARSRRTGTPVSVFFLDLDEFKPINDRLGHKVGDHVLREVGERIRRATRAEDTAARLGGDEFVVVAEGLDLEITRRVADRLAHVISQPVAADDEDLHLTVSIGVAWAHPPLITAGTMVDQADQAMYRAKRSRSGIAFAEPPPIEDRPDTVA